VSADFGDTGPSDFRLIAVGRLARNPEMLTNGELTYTRFCLVGGPCPPASWEGPARGGVTSIWFVAFNPLAELIADGARKGDIVLVGARVSPDVNDYRRETTQSGLRFTVHHFEVTATSHRD
jgi:hypothetical protein